MKINRRTAIKKTGLLAGLAVLAPSLSGILQSCQGETIESWSPEFFKSEEADLISAMVDTIIPRTNTPGGLDVNVHVFLDKMVAEGYDESGKAYMRTELNKLSQQAIEDHGAPFPELDDAAKRAFLKKLEKSSPKIGPGVWGTGVGDQEPPGFYRSLKSMMIWAYASTEKISTEVLNYNPIPGEYNGCIPVSEVGNRWA